MEATQGDVNGIISLVVWSVTLIVSVKFGSFIMRADNDGEGGIMALVALVRRAAEGPVLLQAQGYMFAVSDQPLQPDIVRFGS